MFSQKPGTVRLKSALDLAPPGWLERVFLGGIAVRRKPVGKIGHTRLLEVVRLVPVVAVGLYQVQITCIGLTSL